MQEGLVAGKAGLMVAVGVDGEGIGFRVVLEEEVETEVGFGVDVS